MAAKMQASPATTKDNMRAGPVLSWAATPVSTKMPVPMTAPTPSAESWTGPSTRRRRFSPFISSYNIHIGLRVKSGLLAIESPLLEVLDRRHQAGQGSLGVSEEHRRLGIVEQLVLDAGESRVHAALEHDDAVGLVHVQDRHSVDRAALVRAGGRVDDVVGPDDESDVRPLELLVDFVHIVQAVIGHVRFRQQNVHVARYAAGHGVDRVLYFASVLFDQGGQLSHLVLGL